MNKPRIGCATIIEDDNRRFLFGRRAKKPFEGFWVIPGGGVKFLETLEDAAKREIKEELDLDCKEIEFYTLREIISPPDEHRIVIYYHCTDYSGVPRPGSDISEVKFMDRAELEKLACSEFITPTIRSVVQEMMGRSNERSK